MKRTQKSQENVNLRPLVDLLLVLILLPIYIIKGLLKITK